MKTPHAILIGLSLIAAAIWSSSAVAKEITLLCVKSHSRELAGNSWSWRWILDKEKKKLWTVKSPGEKSAEFTFIRDDLSTLNMWFHRVDKRSQLIVVAFRNDGLLQKWAMSAHQPVQGNASSLAYLFRCNQKKLWGNRK